LSEIDGKMWWKITTLASHGDGDMARWHGPGSKKSGKKHASKKKKSSGLEPQNGILETVCLFYWWGVRREEKT
jgi:hypothetical protein